jgi:hypothetical protein
MDTDETNKFCTHIYPERIKAVVMKDSPEIAGSTVNYSQESMAQSDYSRDYSRKLPNQRTAMLSPGIH